MYSTILSYFDGSKVIRMRSVNSLLTDLKAHFSLWVFLPFFGFLLWLLIGKVFWMDEAATGIHILANVGKFWQISEEMAHAPFYYYLLKGWSSIWGYEPIAIASFSLFSNLLVVISILVYNRKKSENQWFIVFFSIHPAVMHFSIEAKPYALSFLLATWTFIALTHYLKEKHNTKYLLLFLVCIVLGCYTHPWFFILGLTSFILIIKAHRHALSELFKPRLILLAVGVIVTLSPVFLLYLGFNQEGANSFLQNKSLAQLLPVTLTFLTGNHYIIGVLVLLAGLGIHEKVWQKWSKETSYLIQYLVLAFGIALIGHKFAHLFFYRYTFLLLPAILLILSNVTSQISLLNRTGVKWVILILCVPLIYFNYTKERSIEQRTGGKLIHEIDYVKKVTASESGKTMIVNFSSYAKYRYYNEVAYNGTLKLYPIPYDMETHPGYTNLSKLDVTQELIAFSEYIEVHPVKNLILIVSNYYDSSDLLQQISLHIPEFEVKSEKDFEKKIIQLQFK